MATTSPSQSSFMPPAEPYGSGGLLVFDTSAWNRQRDPAALSRWLATAKADLFAVCPVVALELLASAATSRSSPTSTEPSWPCLRPMSRAAPAQEPSPPRSSNRTRALTWA